MSVKRILCALAAAILVFSLYGCKNKPSGEGETSTDVPAPTGETVAETIVVNGFAFGELSLYNGPFVEDGTNEAVQNVAAIRVENRNDSALRYAEFTVYTNMGELNFICTTLLPGRTALLLEQNRTAYKSASVSSVSVKSELFFSEPPTLYPNAFSLTVGEQVLTLKNVSGAPVPGDTFVYFKRYDKQGYVGGITYRVRFTNIPAGQSLSQSSQNLSPADCDLIFIECQNPPGAAS